MKRLLPALVGLTAVLSVLPFLTQWHSAVNDECVVALGASRMLQGDWPFRDFDTRFSPGTYVLLALTFGLTGESLISMRLLMLTNAFVLAFFVYLIAARCLPRGPALLSTTWFLLTSLAHWPVTSYHWVGIAGQLAATWCLLGWEESRRPGWIAGASAASALAGWALQSDGAACILAGILVLAYWRAPWSDWAVAVGTTLGVSLLLWLPFLLVAGVEEVYAQTVLSATRYTVPFNRFPYSLALLASPWSAVQGYASAGQWLGMLATGCFALTLTLKYALFYPVLLAGLIDAYWRRDRALAVVTLSLAAQVLSGSVRQELLYFNYLAPLWLIVLAGLLRRGRWLAVILTVIFTIQYVWLLVDSRRFHYPIVTPRGTLYAGSPEEANLYNDVLSLAAQLTPPGTPTIAYPYASAFLFASGVRNAARPPVLVPVLYPIESAREARQRMDELGVTTVYQFPVSPEGIASNSPTVTPSRFLESSRAFDDVLLSGFAPIQQFGRAAVVYRRESPSPPAKSR